MYILYNKVTNIRYEELLRTVNFILSKLLMYCSFRTGKLIEDKNNLKSLNVYYCFIICNIQKKKKQSLNFFNLINTIGNISLITLTDVVYYKMHITVTIFIWSSYWVNFRINNNFIDFSITDIGGLFNIQNVPKLIVRLRKMWWISFKNIIPLPHIRSTFFLNTIWSNLYNIQCSVKE